MFADKEWKFNGIETSATVRHSKYVSLEANFFIKLNIKCFKYRSTICEWFDMHPNCCLHRLFSWLPS